MTVRALPRSLEDLRGRRAARWIRESTAGQADNFGPDAQLEQQTRAIERWGLVDTGGAWQVAHSGRTIAATGQWAEMLAGAGEDWEVLVVGYVSRFARDLRTAVNARHDLHARGAVILFADERVLSSDEDEWERWAREAVEAEAYSRRLAKRIREGYAAKRRRLGVPGGNRAPLGTVRDGRTITVDEASMAIVRRVYELAAGGRTDREVGAATGLALKHVAEILTNPFYIGRLWSGEPSALGALVDPATWEHVQGLRARYSRRHRGRSRSASTASAASWPAPPAAAGSSGTWAATATRTPARRSARPPRAGYSATGGRSTRACGASRTRSTLYEDAIGQALEHVAVSARLKADAVPRRCGPSRGGGTSWPRPGSGGSASGPRCSSPETATSAASRRRWHASTSRPRRRSTPVTDAHRGRGARLARVASGAVGGDVRRRARDRRGRVRADRRSRGEGLHLHADRRGEGAGLGRGVRAKRLAPRRESWSGQYLGPGPGDGRRNGRF